MCCNRLPSRQSHETVVEAPGIAFKFGALTMKPVSALLAAVIAAAPLAITPDLAAAQGQVVRTPDAQDKLKAEEALRNTIAAFRLGKPNYDQMAQPLADAVKQQSATLAAGLEQLGAMKTLEYQGWVPQASGVFRFAAGFEHGKAEWLIGFGADGKIETLWFKPVS